MTTPFPEPKQYIQAQADSIGKGLRDTVLITPGSALPDFVPQGAKTYYTSKGIVLTTDPSKATMIHNGTDEDVSMALFGVPSNQTGRETLAAVVKDENSLPIAEIALNPSNTVNVMQRLQQMVPDGGLLSVEPKDKLISDRGAQMNYNYPFNYNIGGLLDMYQPKFNMQPNFVPLGNPVMPYESSGFDGIAGDFGPNYGDTIGNGFDGIAGDRGAAFAGSQGNITAPSKTIGSKPSPMNLLGSGLLDDPKPQQISQIGLLGAMQQQSFNELMPKFMSMYGVK